MLDQWIFFVNIYSALISRLVHANEVEKEKQKKILYVLNQPIRRMNFIFFSLIFGSLNRSKNVHAKWKLNFVFTLIADFRQWSRNRVINFRCEKNKKMTLDPSRPNELGTS